MNALLSARHAKEARLVELRSVPLRNFDVFEILPPAEALDEYEDGVYGILHYEVKMGMMLPSSPPANEELWMNAFKQDDRADLGVLRVFHKANDVLTDRGEVFFVRNGSPVAVNGTHLFSAATVLTKIYYIDNGKAFLQEEVEKEARMACFWEARYAAFCAAKDAELARQGFSPASIAWTGDTAATAFLFEQPELACSQADKRVAALCSWRPGAPFFSGKYNKVPNNAKYRQAFVDFYGLELGDLVDRLYANFGLDREGLGDADGPVRRAIEVCCRFYMEAEEGGAASLDKALAPLMEAHMNFEIVSQIGKGLYEKNLDTYRADGTLMGKLMLRNIERHTLAMSLKEVAKFGYVPNK